MTIVALDIDNDSVRVAVAQPRPGGARLTRVVTVVGGGDAKALADRLRSELPEVRWTRAKIVAAVGGDQVSYRLLNLPPMPDSELPDMVALLAEKEFGGEDGVVDFLPLSGDGGSSRTALAARVKQSALAFAKQLAAELDSELERAVVRACSAASVATRLDDSLKVGACLIGAPAGGVTDLVAMTNGSPVVIRTARGEVTADSVEVRRTLSTAGVQLGENVERVSLLGGGSGRVSIAKHSADAWGLVGGDEGVVDSMPGAIGAALDEAEKRTPEFDFLNPRRAETDQAPRRRQLILAGVAAAAVLLGVAMSYLSLWRLDAERESLDSDRRLVEDSIEKFQPLANRAAEIDQWLASDMNWLDEFERIGHELRPQTLKAEDFPEDSDVMLTQFTATSSSGRAGAGGNITLEAIARDPDAPTDLEQRLRNDRVEVQQGSLDQSGDRPYVWRFKPTLKIASPPTAEATAEPSSEAEAAS